MMTFGELARSGQAVYSAECARCHGNEGRGGGAPQLTGGTGIPATYQDAGQLFSKISNTMPRDRPGTLSVSENHQVLSYLMVENGWVDPGNDFNANELSGLALE